MFLVNEIIQGDCLEVMKEIPDKSIDLVVIDPPYGLNYNNGDLASGREAVFGGKLSNMDTRPIASDGENESFELLKSVLTILKDKLLKGGACCCCCCGGGPKPLFAQWTLLMDEIIGFKHAVVWDKGGLGMGMHFRRNYEFVLIAQNGQPAHRWNGGKTTPNVWRYPKIIPRRDQHPTEKPVSLMQQCVQLLSDPGDTILDCFCGTGAVPVACVRENRNFIGIELEEKYCRIARKRVAEERLKLKLF